MLHFAAYVDRERSQDRPLTARVQHVLQVVGCVSLWSLTAQAQCGRSPYGPRHRRITDRPSSPSEVACSERGGVSVLRRRRAAGFVRILRSRDSKFRLLAPSALASAAAQRVQSGAHGEQYSTHTYAFAQSCDVRYKAVLGSLHESYAHERLKTYVCILYCTPCAPLMAPWLGELEGTFLAIA